MYKLGLMGRDYNDIIVELEGIILGETNNILSIEEKRGGVHNLPIINDELHEYFLCGLKKAIVINDISTSTRTSFTSNISNEHTIDWLKVSNCNWIHLAYVDDIPLEALLACQKQAIPSLSVDFCTLNDRFLYLDILKKCTIIFDSRERKRLWEKVCLSIPIVLHDPEGCECLYNGKIIHTASHRPIDNLKVNGAGDIYARYFIDQFTKTGLQQAIKNTCVLTTQKLIELHGVKYEKI